MEQRCLNSLFSATVPCWESLPDRASESPAVNALYPLSSRLTQPPVSAGRPAAARTAIACVRGFRETKSDEQLTASFVEPGIEPKSYSVGRVLYIGRRRNKYPDTATHFSYFCSHEERQQSSARTTCSAVSRPMIDRLSHSNGSPRNSAAVTIHNIDVSKVNQRKQSLRET